LYCYTANSRFDTTVCVHIIFRAQFFKMRRPFGPVTPGRVDAHDDGFLLDDLLDLVADTNDDDFLDGLMDTFTTGQLEQIAASMDVPTPNPTHPPKRKKKRTSTSKHSDVFKKVKTMR